MLVTIQMYLLCGIVLSMYYSLLLQRALEMETDTEITEMYSNKRTVLCLLVVIALFWIIVMPMTILKDRKEKD